MAMSKNLAIGIDLGTTSSCVGVYREGVVEIITNDHGNRTTPSYVAFTDTVPLIGDAAKNQVFMNPSKTVFGAERLIGRRFNDTSFQTDMKHWPFNVVDVGGKPKIKVKYVSKTKTFFPEEILWMILAKMKKNAEAFLGKTVISAVVTVPTSFNQSQRRAIEDAGTVAGLNVLRIIADSTAAAIAYGLDNKGRGEKNVLIFDLGGGTSGVSILTIENGIFEVKSTAGDTHLGGEDFDNRMVNHFVREFENKHRKDLTANKKAISRLRAACEAAKRLLSSASKAQVDVPNLVDSIDLSSSLTRSRFNELNADLFRSMLNLVERALGDAKLSSAQIDHIVLVGGSTRIPEIQRQLRSFFGGKILNKALNADEAAASGAAVLAAVLTGEYQLQLERILLLDVTPASIGVETSGGVMTVLVKRNTTLPTRVTRSLSTPVEDQQDFVVYVYEGERAMTKDNILLGRIELKDIKPATGGEQLIDLTFDIDANYRMTIFATEKMSCKTSRMIPNNKNNLSKEVLEAMSKRAKNYEREDEENKRRIDAKISLESLVYCISSKVRDLSTGFGIPQNKGKELMDKVHDVMHWLENSRLADEEEYEKKKMEVKKMFINASMKY